MDVQVDADVFIGEPGEFLVQLEKPACDYKKVDYVAGAFLFEGKGYSFSFNRRLRKVTAAWDGEACLLDRKDGRERVMSLLDIAVKRLSEFIDAS